MLLRQWFGAATLLLTGSTAPALAEQATWPPTMELDHVLVQAGLYTTHFSDDPDHTDDQHLIGVELHNPDRWFAGGARFRNSFSQDSHYLYVGREFPFWQAGDVTLRAKLSGGLLHGYRGEYRDKIPFNRYGVAPALLPTVGARWKRAEADLIVFGTAGLMVTAGWRF
ncbi:MAG: hypothetical protein ACQEUG_17370 [Pseudomonadota bacterium]